MAALLVAVGVLQYRWTSQVTAATETRIGRNIQALMMDWHLDFYSRFAAICVALQVGLDSGAQDDWMAYRQRYSEWPETEITCKTQFTSFEPFRKIALSHAR